MRWIHAIYFLSCAMLFDLTIRRQSEEATRELQKKKKIDRPERLG